MSSGMLGVGVSGLLAYQRSLQTVSHNIANANTEGYSRQRVVLGTQPAVLLGSGYIGNGVTIQSVNRIYDGFVTGQVRTYQSSFNQADIYAKHSSLIDEMLADPQIGLLPSVDSFFGSVQGVSNDPTSVPARQAMITQSEMLVDRFKYLDQRYEEIRSQVNQQVKDNVSEINSLAQSIADINRQIVLAPGQGAPNDLLDARDKLLNDLSQRVSVSTLEQDNGSVDVFIGKGQVLVLNFDANTLSATRNQYDISQFDISIDTVNGSAIDITDLVNGGKLGGLLEFRKNILDPAQNGLGALAIGISDTFNAQHHLGQDLDGALGGDFFTTPSLQVLPSTGAPSVVTANLDDSGQLTSDEYQLYYNGGTSYTLTRSSDNQSFAIDTGGSDPYTTNPVDGFTLTLTGGAVAGDSYLIRPGRVGSKLLDMAISDPRDIAAAAPVRAQQTVGNAGTGSISAGKVTNTATLPLGGGITLTYNAGNIDIAGAALPPFSVPYVSGSTIVLNDAGDGTGIEVSISGTPVDGDTFTIGDNTNGIGDNRNALLLGQLQTKRVLNNGTASYSELYGSMVADVGIKTGQAQITQDAQSRLLDQAQNARDALSGVNLDEEAANLVKFQQAYQAASQVIVATNTMFQSLLAALRG